MPTSAEKSRRPSRFEYYLLATGGALAASGAGAEVKGFDELGGDSGITLPATAIEGNPIEVYFEYMNMGRVLQINVYEDSVNVSTVHQNYGGAVYGGTQVNGNYLGLLDCGDKIDGTLGGLGVYDLNSGAAYADGVSTVYDEFLGRRAYVGILIPGPGPSGIEADDTFHFAYIDLELNEDGTEAILHGGAMETGDGVPVNAGEPDCDSILDLVLPAIIKSAVDQADEN